MSILTLPSEILLTILKNCKVSDICQVGLSCNTFNTLIKEQSLWLNFCQRAFPNLEFRAVDKDYRNTYQHEVQKYEKLLGIWISQTSPMVITTNNVQLYGFYFGLYVKVFGEVPLAMLRDTLRVEWNSHTQSWGTPFSTILNRSRRPSINRIPVEVDLGADNQLHIKHDQLILYLNKKFEKISVFVPALPQLQEVLPQGLFVESVKSNPMCSMVKVSYTQDLVHVKIEQFAKQGTSCSRLSSKTTRVSLLEVVDLSDVKLSEPGRSKHVKELTSLDLTDKVVPPHFMHEYLGDFDITKISSTYRVALACVSNLVNTDRIPGLCIIFNDNVFCVLNYNEYDTIRLYHSLDHVLAERMSKKISEEHLIL